MAPRRQMTHLLAFSIACVGVLASGCSKLSQEQLAMAAKECVKFYKSEDLPYAFYVTANDAWLKDGRIVTELAVRKSEDAKSYSTRLCVIDEDKGTVSIPAVTNQARWER